MSEQDRETSLTVDLDEDEPGWQERCANYLSRLIVHCDTQDAVDDLTALEACLREIVAWKKSS